MRIPFPKADDKNFGKVLAIKQAVSQGILTATARVRSDQLKPAQADHMKAVLAQVRQARLGSVPAGEQLQITDRDSDEDQQQDVEGGGVAEPIAELAPGDAEEAALADFLFS